MDDQSDMARAGARIDRLIERGRYLDAAARDDAPSPMPRALLRQLAGPLAHAVTPGAWTAPLLCLLVLVALGGALYWVMADAASAGPPGVRAVLVCAVCALAACATGVLLGQGHTLGIQLTKWLPRICGAACLAVLGAQAMGGSMTPWAPPAMGLVASLAAWRLANTDIFSGFVTYRLLLRQVRHLDACASPDGDEAAR